jgi:hypothetical protein
VTARRASAVLAVLLLLGLVLFGGTQAAAADPAASPSGPPAPPGPGASTLAITTPSAGDFLGKSTVTIIGTKVEPGSSVVVTAAGDARVTVCATTTETPDGRGWSCSAVGVPNGPRVLLTATETRADSSTATATVTIAVLAPPTLDGPGSFTTPGLVSGGARNGATVTVTVSGGQGCASGVANGYWSCSIAAPSGTYTVTAHQSDSAIGNGRASSESAAQQVTVDKDAPAPPVVTSPKANARVLTQPVTFAGRGEALGVLNVYVDASPVCSASVSPAGTWSCAASGIKNGTHAVQAIQRDLAGNFSSPCAPVKVFFGPKAAITPPVAPPPGTTSPTPPPTTGPTPPPAPDYQDPGTPARNLGEALTNWGTPTGFGASLPTLSEAISHGNLLIALVLAFGFIALIALPLRLLASTLRGRLTRPRTRFMGRNQEVAEPDAATPVNPWLAGAVPFAAAVALIVLSGGVGGEVRYLRLTAAVAAGLALLNVAAVALAALLAAKGQRLPARLRFLPTLLFAAAAAAVLSRLAGIDPPLLAGVLIGVAFSGTLAARPRAIVSLVEIGTITALSVTAWLMHGWMGPVTGFWASLTSEMFAAVCLAGFGSALVLVLPIAALPGRALLEWSAPWWLATVAVVTTLASVVILGAGKGSPFPLLGSLIAAVAFSAVSVAAWSWVRFVEPADQ